MANSTLTILGSLMNLDLIYKLTIAGSIIALGAFSYTVQANRVRRTGGHVTTKMETVQNFVVGVFSGFVFLFICLAVVDNDLVAYAGGGVGAFMGFAGITKIGQAFIKFAEKAVPGGLGK